MNPLLEATKNLIISASGWRKIFTPENENSDSPNLSEDDKLLCYYIAKAFILAQKPDKTKSILVATDTRPTGPQIVSCMLSAIDQDLTYIGIASAPEVMAYSRDEKFSCFIYISASHNPLGHNGFKFGFNGGVYSKDENQVIADTFLKLIQNPEELKPTYKNFKINQEEKQKALEAYKKSIFNSNVSTNIGIVADFNGSARILSIDKALFNELNVPFACINDTPGLIAHAIVPEGKNLIPCKEFLQEMHKKDPRFVLGYTPDNDGDRGNLVYIDANEEAQILKAQEVFALVVYAQLYTSKQKNLAIAANGPTSLRVEEICKRFGARCFRAEVGEANVVELAEDLRIIGYSVPLCGEGSNGGCIIHPSKVRDPLGTLMTLLSCGLDVQSILKELPTYTTTDAFSPLAGMKVPFNDFAAFKTLYEKAFESNFFKIQSPEINSYVEYQLEGTRNEKIPGPSGRSGNCRGGLKYLLKDAEGEDSGFIWLRPSGTEPLLRLLVDLKGDKVELHDKLLNFQRELISSISL